MPEVAIICVQIISEPVKRFLSRPEKREMFKVGSLINSFSTSIFSLRRLRLDLLHHFHERPRSVCVHLQFAIIC